MNNLLKLKLFIGAIFVLSLGACQKKEAELTKEQIQQRADSIYNSKVKRLEKQAQEDLDRRMSIELKPKIDSLLGRTAQSGAPPAMQEESPIENAPDTSNSKSDNDSIK